jgi:hypothetical protein
LNIDIIIVINLNRLNYSEENKALPKTPKEFTNTLISYTTYVTAKSRSMI